jgi:type I restriction enzyme, S subunit
MGLWDIHLPCPPQEEQHDIISAIESETGNYARIQQRVEVSIELLREYRTALISAAVTGKIDVRDIAA